MSQTDYDVIIVGAGLVGSALAAALIAGDDKKSPRAPLRIALIEGRELNLEWPTQAHSHEANASGSTPSEIVKDFDVRVSAITKASQQWLESLDAWPGSLDQRVSPYRRMHVWDAEGTGAVQFDAAEVNQGELGHIVENRLLTTALVKRVVDSRQIDIFSPQQLVAIEPEGEGYRVQLEGDQQLSAALLVAADGGHSRVRELAGVNVREWDYGHRAIVTTVACEQAHEFTAWQRFLPEGPLAFLPLSDAARENRYCSIVWSAIPSYADNLLELEDDAFCRQLAVAFEHRLGTIEACSKRFSFPLQQRHAVDYVGPGLALIGDAAHSIHPLAGQGVNLGLSDARVLAEELQRAWRRSLPLGSEEVLHRYQRRRKADNLSMMAGMEGFKRLFEQRALPVRWLRNQGMRLVDHSPFMKRQIMRRAMGL